MIVRTASPKIILIPPPHSNESKTFFIPLKLLSYINVILNENQKREEIVFEFMNNLKINHKLKIWHHRTPTPRLPRLYLQKRGGEY